MSITFLQCAQLEVKVKTNDAPNVKMKQSKMECMYFPQMGERALKDPMSYAVDVLFNPSVQVAVL